MVDKVKDGKLNPSFFREGQRVETPKLAVKILGQDSNTTYIGKTAMGLSGDTDLSIWQILKITVSGTTTNIQYADGNEFFDNIWDNVLSLNYA